MVQIYKGVNVIFNRFLIGFIMASFCSCLQAKNLTIKMNTSYDNVNISIKDLSGQTIKSFSPLTKNSWENNFIFDDSNLKNYQFINSSSSSYDIFYYTISGENQGDDTICCMISDVGQINYCVYNNSFPGYPGCK